MLSTLSLDELLVMCILLIFIACKSDPVIPDGGLPPEPPVQDPGLNNPCEEGEISFQHQVLPIMISSCAYSGCHDPASAEDDIVLNNYENVRKEVSPGNANNSELYESITESDSDDIMPPPPAPRLTSAQIGIIRDWINQGAKNTDCGAPCDPEASAFAADILPMLQNYCIGCHNASRSDGGVNLESYDKVIPYVEDGSLIGSMKYEVSFAPMPPSGSRLSDCRIAQVQKWIDEGAQNN